MVGYVCGLCLWFTSVVPALENQRQKDQVQGQPQLHRDFKVNLCYYIQPCPLKQAEDPRIFQLSHFMDFHDFLDSRSMTGQNTGICWLAVIALEDLSWHLLLSQNSVKAPWVQGSLGLLLLDQHVKSLGISSLWLQHWEDFSSKKHWQLLDM